MLKPVSWIEEVWNKEVKIRKATQSISNFIA